VTSLFAGNDTFFPIFKFRDMFETAYNGTVFGGPVGTVTLLPDGLGGDPNRWPTLGAVVNPVVSRRSFLELLRAKAHFLMLPKRIVDFMVEVRPRLTLTEDPVKRGILGETDELDSPRTATIRFPGASAALARVGHCLGRPCADNDPYETLGTIYHELTHAWLWLQEFADGNLQKLYADGLTAYATSTGVKGTTFAPHNALTESVAYYVEDRILRWCTALSDLADTRVRPFEVDLIETAYDSRGLPDAIVNGEKLASPALPAPLRDAIDRTILEGLPLTKPFAGAIPLVSLRNARRG
jgi:hypothetical protein